MAEKRFKSKVDTWVALLLIVVVTMDIAFIVFFLMSAENSTDKIRVASIMTAVLALLVWLMLRTYYVVDGKLLRVIAGPFRWKIVIDEIKSVTPTRSLWSSPALSLDRLRIVYGNGRRVMVSPANKQDFLQAIGHADAT